MQVGREKNKKKNQLLVGSLLGPVVNFILRIFVCKNETKGKRKGGNEEGENSHGKEKLNENKN